MAGRPEAHEHGKTWSSRHRAVLTTQRRLKSRKQQYSGLKRETELNKKCTRPVNRRTMLELEGDRLKSPRLLSSPTRLSEVQKPGSKLLLAGTAHGSERPVPSPWGAQSGDITRRTNALTLTRRRHPAFILPGLHI